MPAHAGAGTGDPPPPHRRDALGVGPQVPETGKNLELLDMLQVPRLPRVSAPCRLFYTSVRGRRRGSARRRGRACRNLGASI